MSAVDEIYISVADQLVEVVKPSVQEWIKEREDRLEDVYKRMEALGKRREDLVDILTDLTIEFALGQLHDHGMTWDFVDEFLMQMEKEEGKS